MKLSELFENKNKWFLLGEATYVPADYGAESFYSIHVGNSDDSRCSVAAMVFRKPNSDIEFEIHAGSIKKLSTEDKKQIEKLIKDDKQISDIIKKYQADWKTEEDSFNDDDKYVPPDLTGM